MKNLIDRIKVWRRERKVFGAMVCGVLSLVALILVHGALGFEPALKILYILPIWLSVRLGGRWIGVGIAVLSALSLLGIDLHVGHVLTDRLMVDSLVRLVIFTGLALIIDSAEQQLRQAQYLALHDPLTGLYNRRALDGLADTTPSQRSARVVAMIDCDGFKAVNDEFGHDAGDEVLRILSRILQAETRKDDVVARMGGDEFVIVLQNSGPVEANVVLQRIETAFDAAIVAAGYGCTITAGIATTGDSTTPIDELVRMADLLMFERKAIKKSTAYLN